MQRTIVYILGTSYSGSSLLNSLLDAQPSTRGLGEAVHLVHGPNDAWCGHCQCPVEDCRLQRSLERDDFYGSLYAFYPDTRVFVNSSKNWELCFQQTPLPPDGDSIRIIVLSKSLKEFAHSFSIHEQASYESSMDAWLRVYRRLMDNLDAVFQGATTTEIQCQLIGRLAPADVAFVSYRELVTQTDCTLRRLSRQLSLPFASHYRQQLFNSDTCTIGGNNAIYAQRTCSVDFFRDCPTYLGGKYQGRQGVIFYDDQWLGNDSLCQAAQQWRRAHDQTLQPLESRLRQRGTSPFAPTGIR